MCCPDSVWVCRKSDVLGMYWAYYMHQEGHTSERHACDLGLNSTGTGDASGRRILASLRSLKYFSDEFSEQKKLGASREIQVYGNPCTHLSSKNKNMPALMVCEGSIRELAGISEPSQSMV